MAKLIDDTEKSIQKCAEYLKKGKLVAFPTETVYGLGGNLFDENAIEKIYLAKQRPKSDPLIVHIKCAQDAKELININDFQQKCLNLLANAFWPGPLTVVVPASEMVSKNVMGGGDHIGIRVPSHPIAQKLLQYCNIPIVAPSANTFGHVSPTSADHVFDDLKNVQDLYIIQTEINCNVGIESTVIKLEKENSLTILRLGTIGVDKIKKIFKKENLSFHIKDKKNYDVQLNSQNVSRETFLHESPGQNLTHYSPWIPTFIFSKDKNVCKKILLENKMLQQEKMDLKKSVFIDFGSKYNLFKDIVLKYYDLSEKGDPKEAAFCLFSILRLAEKTNEATKILIANFPLDSTEHEALFDRIYRAASGKILS